VADVKSENYIVIQGWMVNDLKLKGNRLLIFAIIHGFSQSKQGVFCGSLQYLANWTNITKRNVIENLKCLESQNLIEKSEIFENGVKFCAYKSRVDETSPGVMKHHRGGDETSPGVVMKQPGGGDKTSPNNISNNLSNNLLDNMPDSVKAVFSDWLQYKKERKQSYTETGLSKLITQLENNVQRYGAEAVIEVINDSIAANYQGIVWDKLKSRKPSNGAYDYANASSEDFYK